MNTHRLIVVTIGLLCGVYYLRFVIPDGGGILEYHQPMLDGVAASPYRYRVLAPFLVSLFGSTPSAALAGYAIGHLVVFPLMFLALYAWLRVWLSEVAALLGVCLTAAYIPLMMQVWLASFPSAIEVVFLAAGLVILSRRHRGWEIVLCGVIALGTLNRETAALLPLVFGALYLPRWREAWYWRRAVLFGAVFVGVYAGLRLALGSAPDSVPVALAWQMNTSLSSRSLNGLVNNALFLPVWAVYLLNLRYAPAELRRLALPALVYAGMIAVFGLWDEVRLLLPLLTLTLPVALRGLHERPVPSFSAGD